MVDSDTPVPPVEELAACTEATGTASWFDRIVQPLGTQEFLDTRYRDKRPVLFRGDGARFASLCTWDELNALVCTGSLRSRARLVRNGQSIPDHLYTTPPFGLGWRVNRRVVERPIDDGRMMALLREGASIVVSGVQDLYPPIRPLADSFEETLGGYAAVNLYASWAPTPGFATHWDSHDVFIVQVTGEKRWQVYGETRRFPLIRDAEATVEPPPEMVWTDWLRAGDVLYLPRGWWHDARAEADDGTHGEGSMHLTCSVTAVTGLDFMEWLAGRLARHEAFRRDLPHPADAAADAHYAALREMIVRELQDDPGGRFRDHLHATWSERPQASLGPYIEPWRSPDWERYAIALRGARHATVKRNANGEATLHANGFRWTVDGRFTELVSLLCRGDAVPVASLRAERAETAPGETTPGLVDRFLTELLTKGIVRAIPPAGS